MTHDIECAMLYCFERATVAVTVPRYQPQTPLCDECADHQLTWAEPYRKRPGAVSVEKLEAHHVDGGGHDCDNGRTIA